MTDTSDHLRLLVNALLRWEEGAHELLGDYLEEIGFERQFHEQGGLHSRVGVMVALVRIKVISLEQINRFELPLAEQSEVRVRIANTADNG